MRRRERCGAREKRCGREVGPLDLADPSEKKVEPNVAKRLRLDLAAACMAIALSGPAWAQDAQVITKQYDDGGVYEGTFRDGKQHGTGTYRLPNGYVYSGEWIDGEIRGQGRAEFPNGSVYEGEFAAGKPEGRGRIVFADGGTYEGAWADGKINGQGVANYANGVT